MHFDPKKYIKNYKMRFIQNKEDMISYYQLKKNGKKSKGGSKITSKLSQKCTQNDLISKKLKML